MVCYTLYFVWISQLSEIFSENFST